MATYKYVGSTNTDTYSGVNSETKKLYGKVGHIKPGERIEAKAFTTPYEHILQIIAGAQVGRFVYKAGFLLLAIEPPPPPDVDRTPFVLTVEGFKPVAGELEPQ